MRATTPLRIGLAAAQVASLAVVAGLLTACDDDFVTPSRIVDTRVLGTRVEVVDDPERATPRPGETARVSLTLAAPDGVDEARVKSLIVRCTFPERYTGIPICQEFLDLLASAEDGTSVDALSQDRFVCEDDFQFAFAGVGISCQQGEPSVDVPIEPDFEGDAKLIRGVICDGGEPYLDATDPTLFGCDGGSGTRLFHAGVPVSRSVEEDNSNPDLSDLRIELNDVEWADVQPNLARVDPDDCASWARNQGLREIDPFEHRIKISVSRDAVEREDGGCERLEIAGHATAGEITPLVAVFDRDGCEQDRDEAFEQTIEWEGLGIARPDPDGKLVSFVFAVRDGRGGFVAARRTACVYTREAP